MYENDITMPNLTVQEALKYLKQLSENHSEGDDNDKNVSMNLHDEYLPENEDNLDRMKKIKTKMVLAML